MPILKSGFKRMKTSREKHLANKSEISRFKTMIKKIRTSVEANQKQEAEQLLKATVSLLDKAAKKNVIHKKTAARQKSRLAKKIHVLASK